MRQFASTVKKNAIEKRRNIRVTICECFSHLVMFVILLLGFGLSTIVYFQPENFVKVNFLVPPTFYKQTLTKVPTRFPTHAPTLSPLKSAVRAPVTSAPLPISPSNLLVGIKKQLKGPMPIPTFDQYIALMKFVTSAAATEPSVSRVVKQTAVGLRFGNLLSIGELHFSPYPSAAVDSLVKYLNKTTTSFKTLKSHFHATEEDGVSYILNNLDKRALALIVIRQITPQKINYVIRQNYTTLPNTNQIFVSISRGLDTNFQMYLVSGFLTLESTIDKWALTYSVQQVNRKATCTSPDVMTVPFPTYEFDSNPFYAQVGFLLGLAMTMSTLYPVSRLVKCVVEEKETRMREVMKIMGLSQTIHQLSWFFTAFILFFWMSLTSTFVAHISFLPNTNIFILFIYFFLFHMSEIMLCFLISVFFSNSKLAAIVGPVVLFVTILPKYVFFGSNSDEAYVSKYAASLLSPTAFTFGADILAEYEYSSIGVQFSNLSDNNFSMVSVFQMMFIDIFIYGFLAWYLDQTIPHEVGTPKHPLFLFNPYYWFPRLRKVAWLNTRIQERSQLGPLPSEMNTKGVLSIANGDTGISHPGISPSKSVSYMSEGTQNDHDTLPPPTNQRLSDEFLIEMPTIHNYGIIESRSSEQAIPALPTLEPTIFLPAVSADVPSDSINTFQEVNDDIEVLGEDDVGHVKVIASRLEKKYPNGKVAVRSFSLAMLEGQITCLLGHNGAGKSSVIAMITGLTTITGGDCTVYDQPLLAALSEIRTMTGICPQQNVLFPSLTVKEHLNFFGCVKGLYGKKLQEEVIKMIHDVGLFAKKDTPAGALSGGMKRKLQLAMALIGGSQFLILDEPTSGMDPFSRRATWELLQRHKAGRVIVLTTHFLEEADILGDRIAIMSEGSVRTSGSSLFLKTRFGAGYLLSISISRLGRFRKIHDRKVENFNKASVNKYSEKEDPLTPQEAFMVPFDEEENLEQVVKYFIPAAVVTSQVAGEIIFSLPIQSVPMFADLFNALREKSVQLGIESYGVSLTSLEQVFIKLAKESESVEVEVAPKTLFNKAKQTIFQMAGSVKNPLRDTAFDKFLSHKGLEFKDNKEGKVLPLRSKDENDARKASGIEDSIVTSPHKEKYQNEKKPSNAPNGLAVDTKGLVNSTSSNTDFTTYTDGSNEDNTGPSPGCTTVRTHSKAVVPIRTGGSKPIPGTPVTICDATGRVITQPYDHEPSSPDKSSCWSIDVSLHSCESHDVERAQKQASPGHKKPDFEDVDLDCADGEDYKTIHSVNVAIQAAELIRKRYITSSRDLKGVFFQVVFPAIQILLILAILTIEINPAGHTVKMNASIFGFKPNTLVSGRTGPDSFAQNLSSARLIINKCNATTSFGLSSDLLDSGNKYFKGAKALARTFPPADHRLGAVVFKDTLPVEFDIDWAWVKDNLGYILSNSFFIEFLLGFFGLGDGFFSSPQSVTVPAYFITGIVGPKTATNNPKKNFEDFLRSVAGAANLNKTAVNQVLNSTAVSSFNSTGIYNSNSQQSITVDFDGIDSGRKGITVKQVSLESNGKKTSVGDVTLTRSQIRYLLPDHTIEYHLDVPVPVTVMHNSSSAHGIAAFRGEVVSAAWQQCYDDLNVTKSQRRSQPDVVYLAKNHPLPLTATQSLQNRIILSLLASLFIIVPLCYIPASFITFVVRERMSKAKHLQLVSSVSPYLYWCTTYLWDMGLFLILVLLIVVALFIYGKKAAEIFISVNEATYAVFLLLFMYGLSVLPLCYLYSMFFENHSTAQISIMAINFATGFVAVLAYFVMNTVPTTQEAASKIVHFFRFFPPYNIGEGLIAITSAFFENTLLGGNVSYFAWRIAGRPLTFMACEAIGYFSLVLLTESSYYREGKYWLERKRALLVLKKSVMQSTDADGNIIPVIKDEDIIIEEETIRNTKNKGDFALCIEDLVKIYPSNFFGGKAKHAVRGLTLGCQSGEIFGFLGVNGAGKSSTLNVLTGDIAPTGGEVYIAGMPLSDPKTRQAIGYCPQTDPLFDLMTARETLWFYGRIRGIESGTLKRKVNALITQVGLTHHADRTSGTYSGGNKRKLSLAISLIGSPKVLLLDEPSSGMDPFARRQMWDVIAAVSEKRSVILTTHSMEECEALCTRIGIMVDGRLRCLGPSSHLKARFGNGYQIEVRFNAENRFEECMQLLKGICEDIEIDEKHGLFLRMKVPALDLGYAFQVLEESKVSASGCVVDYTVSQNTLEQVFLKFARMQEQIEGEEHHVDVVAMEV